MADTLALAYRPMRFSDIVGNENIARILKNSVLQGKVVNAYFFSGGRGTGKTSIARILSKALQCENLQEDGEPCGVCQNCVDITEGRCPDVIELDAASENSVQGIRELTKTLSYYPTSAKYKILIIDECHSLSQQASNALLKTLEEPPSHAKFIFCTTEPHKVLDTIRSRCLVFNFKDIQVKDVVKRLRFIADRENINIDDRALQFIAKYANGGMRDAVMLLEQSSFCKTDGSVIKSQDIMDIVGFVTTSDIQELFTILKGNSLEDLGNWLDTKLFSPTDIISSAISFLETLLYIKQGVSPSLFISKDSVPSVMAMASNLSFSDIILIFNEFRQTLYDLRNLSVVNTSSLFKLRMFSLFDKLNSNGVREEDLKIKTPQTKQAFNRLKEDFGLVRVPLESLIT